MIESSYQEQETSELTDTREERIKYFYSLADKCKEHYVQLTDLVCTALEQPSGTFYERLSIASEIHGL